MPFSQIFRSSINLIDGEAMTRLPHPATDVGRTVPPLLSADVRPHGLHQGGGGSSRNEGALLFCRGGDGGGGDARARCSCVNAATATGTAGLAGGGGNGQSSSGAEPVDVRYGGVVGGPWRRLRPWHRRLGCPGAPFAIVTVAVASTCRTS